MSKSDTTVLYFAYGSNLDGAQMRSRCPSARKAGNAVLLGYAIAFGGWSSRWNGAVASVKPVLGSHVEGLLYRIEASDLLRLDLFEGCPTAYCRLRKNVLDDSDKRRRAHVYMQTPEYFGDQALPSKRYFDVILREYKRNGFKVGALAAAIGARP